MLIEQITKELPRLYPPSIEGGVALASVVSAFSVKVVRLNGTSYAAYDESENLESQLCMMANTLHGSLAALENELHQMYYPDPAYDPND